MTILDTLVQVKQKELKDYPENVEVVAREKPRNFLKHLNEAPGISLIAEVKRASPSKGDINTEMNPLEQAREYIDGGADAISVLTESEYFKGDIEDMKDISQSFDVPVLNKDFIIDKRQIARAYNFGADIILLIVTILNDEELSALYDYAKSLDLNVIVEVHNDKEIERALKISPEIIGINNRDLKTFTVDISNTENLIDKYKKDDIHFIAESGIHDSNDAKRMIEKGASAMLVGESLMKASNIKEKIKELKEGVTVES
jgi:indole-3-glycerol phosphate synthase